jgi:F-type H+-transporting ATPase subunit b
VRSLVAGVVIAATVALGPGVALAQAGEGKAAPAGEAGSAAPAPRRKAPRPNRYTEYWARRAAVKTGGEGGAAGASSGAPAAPTPPPPATAPAAAEAPAQPLIGGIDGGIDGGEGLDTLPAIAALHESPAPDHQPAVHAPASGHVSDHAKTAGEHGTSEAEHGEHASFKVGTFILQLLNFGVLLFLLIYFGGKAMNKSLRARHEQLKTELAEAARLRDEAKQKLEGQERRLAELEKELAAVRASMRQDAEREQARLLEAAQERAKKIQEEMRVQLDQQVKEAEMHLRAEVASASVKLAEELLRKSVDTQDERRLAQEFVAGFAKPTAGGPR